MAASSVLDVFFFSSRRRHTRFDCDWSSDVCSSDLHRRDDGSLTEVFACGTAAVITPVAAVKSARGSWTVGDGEPGEVSMRLRSEERRVGKECRSRWSPYH